MFTLPINRHITCYGCVAVNALLLVFMAMPGSQVKADDRYSRYEDYHHRPYSDRNRHYSDDAFGPYKYPRGRPIPGDGLNWGNRPGDGLNYGRDRNSRERYPDFRRYPQRRSFSDNSGPRQSEPDNHNRNDADYRYGNRQDNWRGDHRGWSNPRDRGYGYGYQGHQPRHERGTRDGYFGSRHHEDRSQGYRRPSSSNAYRPRVNQR